MATHTKSQVTILAETAMTDGICIAGVDSTNKWFRPVPRSRNNFTPSMLSYENAIVVEPYNEIEFVTRKHLNNSPHSEDVEIDESKYPKLLRTLSDSQLQKLMGQIDEHNSASRARLELENWLVGMERSLMLTSVDQVISAQRNTNTFEDKHDQRRIIFRIGSA